MKIVTVWGRANSKNMRLELSISGDVTFSMHGSGSKKKSTVIATCDPQLTVLGNNGEVLIDIPVDAVIKALTFLPDILQGPVNTTKAFEEQLLSGDRQDIIAGWKQAFIRKFGWIRDHFIFLQKNS